MVVVDGSPPPVFAGHHAAWGRSVRHLPPDQDLVTPNGKVGGVLTGVRHATHERLVIADDDVRYDHQSLERLVDALGGATLVRPQNFFSPLPWHACWDTSRSLLNRVTGGDWPGTMGVRRSAVMAAGGYSGDVLFENLELARTIRRGGGSEIVAYDLFVRRLPPTVEHFWSQRVRQAYDELARPHRLAAYLAVGPAVLAAGCSRAWWKLAGTGVALIALAEAGRRKGAGETVFPFRCSLWAPIWVAERSVCSWLAVVAWARGGMPYRGTRLRRAATPLRERRPASAQSADRFRPSQVSS